MKSPEKEKVEECARNTITILEEASEERKL